jgi:hypothetical protein
MDIKMSSGEKGVLGTVLVIFFLVMSFLFGMVARETSIQSHMLRCDENNISPHQCVQMLWPGFGK